MMHPALANPFTTSAASVMRAVEPAAAPLPKEAAAAGTISNSAPVALQAADRQGPRFQDHRGGAEAAPMITFIFVWTLIALVTALIVAPLLKRCLKVRR
jgi:hypothetical protein